MIDRRTLLLGLLAAPLMTPAAAQVRKPRLAILAAGSATGPQASVWNILFREPLAELGWVEGRTIEIVARFAEGALDRMPALAAELVALNPDVILTHTRNGAFAAAEATRTIPIVVGAAGEEALIELAGGLARPKGNVTGLTLVSHEQHAKVLELLQQAHPTANRIGILVDPLSAGYRDYPTQLTGLLGPLRLELVRVEAQDQGGLDAAFAAMATARVDAVFVTADPNFNRPAMDRRINELARAQRIPIVATFDGVVREGGLLSLGADYQVLIRRAAVYVDKILRGAKPGDLPIERPTAFKLVVNLKTAKALGLTMPPSILLRADEVIE